MKCLLNTVRWTGYISRLNCLKDKNTSYAHKSVGNSEWLKSQIDGVCLSFIYLSQKPKFHGVLNLMERKGKLVFQAVAPIPCSHRFVSVQRGWILDGGKSTQRCSREWGSKGLHQGQLPIPCLCLYPLVNSCIMYYVSNLIYQCLYRQTEGFISGSSKTRL